MVPEKPNNGATPKGGQQDLIEGKAGKPRHDALNYKRLCLSISYPVCLKAVL